MTTIETPPEVVSSATPARSEAEPWLDILLQVARRADAIARRQQTTARELDRRVWLRAELEIFDGSDPGDW